MEYVARSDRIWATQVVIDDRHAEGCLDPRRVTAHQVSRSVGKPVREGRVAGAVRLSLVGQLAPRGQCVVVVRERLVRPRGRDLLTDGAVQRGDDAGEVLRVEQRVATGGDRADGGRGHRLRGTGPRHDQRIGHDQTAEVERVPQVTQDVGRKARRSPGGIPVRVGDERAHHTAHTGADGVFERRQIRLLQLGECGAHARQGRV